MKPWNIEEQLEAARVALVAAKTKLEAAEDCRNERLCRAAYNDYLNKAHYFQELEREHQQMLQETC